MVVFPRFPNLEETPSSQRVMTFLAGFEFVLYRFLWENEKTDLKNRRKSFKTQRFFNLGKLGKT